MNLVYVMVPFFRIDSPSNIEPKCIQMLNIDEQQAKNKINIHQITNNQYAVEIKNLNLHFMEINNLIENYQQQQRKIELYENLLQDYQTPIANTDEYLSENQNSVMKKMKKYKDLKQENKKLKKLLQVQLQNTQKVRQQTQKTMKVLREQFDALVMEISKKEKGQNQAPYESHSNPPQLEARDYQVTNKEKHSQSGGGKHISIR